MLINGKAFGPYQTKYLQFEYDWQEVWQTFQLFVLIGGGIKFTGSIAHPVSSSRHAGTDISFSAGFVEAKWDSVAFDVLSFSGLDGLQAVSGWMTRHNKTYRSIIVAITVFQEFLIYSASRFILVQ